MARLWTEVKKAIEKETNSIWLKEPAELTKFKNGELPGQPGTYGQIFGALTFVSGESRDLSLYCSNVPIKASYFPDMKLAHLTQLAKMLCAIPAEFLGYAGLKTVWDLTEQLFEGLDSISTVEEFRMLMSAYAIYVARVQLWVHFIYPWATGLDNRLKKQTVQARTHSNNGPEGARGSSSKGSP